MSGAANTPWHAALHDCQQNGTPHVLATQVTAQGSTPREPGARMIVTSDHVFDTLGGGTFEWQTIQAARRYLEQDKAGFHLEAFALGGRSGQCCGGFVNVLLEVFPGTQTHLAVFGAGHIGRHVIELTDPLDWQRYWCDSRPDTLPLTPESPRLSLLPLENVGQRVNALPSGCHALVMTHSHDEDYALIEALIERDDIASIGLIGSESKWASFTGRLQRAGYSPASIERVRSPIGAFNGAKLNHKSPYAIALTAVTELLWLIDTSPDSATRGLESAPLRAFFNDHQPVQVT
ncbi:xanthine dehydrogenase accessory protein XdhC [Halomonas sp. PAMB 3264]|uniref:xanthine dehydrogenase accessory protein XdhC n=1 Tax=Halomonas sp. PAMB 3264 TaxID=3075222 RepID=UPI002898A683|nr:xanthine dehydrogenase accessory protein XdhC [Halomonas sp. PAMB 3264]WNL40816.1 xanthine dehydrogenase accessory protein XdhC [Halomonas sp. PAMB 3264]